MCRDSLGRWEIPIAYYLRAPTSQQHIRSCRVALISLQAWRSVFGHSLLDQNEVMICKHETVFSVPDTLALHFWGRDRLEAGSKVFQVFTNWKQRLSNILRFHCTLLLSQLFASISRTIVWEVTAERQMWVRRSVSWWIILFARLIILIGSRISMKQKVQVKNRRCIRLALVAITVIVGLGSCVGEKFT